MQQNKYPANLVTTVITALLVIPLINPNGFQSKTIAMDVKNAPLVLGVRSPIRGRGEIEGQNPGNLPSLNSDDLENISAKSYLVYDEQTGHVLAQKNPDNKTAIASLTKLMNALVVYEFGDLSDEYTVQSSDKINVSPVLKLKTGDKIKVQDLFDSMLIGSNNDAALALANYLEGKTGNHLVDLMNEKAEQLGMENTRFSNPMGFDSDQNYSTANDLKILVQETRQLGAFVDLGRKTHYSFTSGGGISYRTVSTNKLLTAHPEIEAVKTGHTALAQGAMITSITKNNRDYIIIVLGSQDREYDTLTIDQALLKKS